MNKIRSGVRLVVLATAGLITVLAAAGSARADFLADETVRLTGTQDKQAFIAGSLVEIEAEVRDDVYAAGGDIEVEDSRLGDLTAAGGLITLRRSSVEDATLAGGNLEIEAEIRDDLIAFGGRIRLERGARVGGDAVVAGFSVTLSGDIDGNARIAGAYVRIDGRVAGDLEIDAEEVSITPEAVILGQLTYRAPEPAEIAPGARIGGPVEQLEREGVRGALSFFGWLAAAIAVWLATLVALLILAAVLHGLFPGLLDRAAESAWRRRWASLALGFAILVATPVAGAILAGTVVGLPLAFFVMALYAVALAFGVINAGYVAGRGLARAAGRRPDVRSAAGYLSRVGWTAVGLALLGLIGVVPFIGGLAVLAAMLFGLGGFVLVSWPAAQEGAAR